MITVNIHQAKTQLSKLLNVVANGDEVIIARAGKPIAVLKQFGEKKQKRKPGLLKGKLTISNDFDAPLPDDILKSFSGE